MGPHKSVTLLPGTRHRRVAARRTNLLPTP